MEQMIQLLNQPLVQIGVMIAIFLLLLWILKSLIKASIFIVIFYIGFNVLFLWTPQQFEKNFFIVKMFKEETAQKVYDSYEEFYNKRQEFSPLDEERIKEDLEKKEQETKDFIGEKVTDITSKIPMPIEEQDTKDTDKTANDVLKKMIDK